MQIELYDDIEKFYNDNIEAVGKEEALNNLMIGNMLEGIQTKNTMDWIFGRIVDENMVELIFLNRPPFHLLMYSPTQNQSDELYEFLAKELYQRKLELLGVNSEITIAKKFANSYTNFTNKEIRVLKKLRILKLEKLNKINIKDGIFRKAKAQDFEQLVIFFDEFYKEALGKEKTKTELQEECKKNFKNIYVLEKNERIVAQALEKRSLLYGECVSAVYTDKTQRGKGYARTCVYQLSKKILEEGAKYCVLYTDDSNPISNHVYEKIGYKNISSQIDLDFID